MDDMMASYGEIVGWWFLGSLVLTSLMEDADAVRRLILSRLMSQRIPWLRRQDNRGYGSHGKRR